MKGLVILCCIVSFAQQVRGFVIPVNCSIFHSPSNGVQIGWNAYSGSSYVVQIATNLSGPWQSNSVVVASSNSVYQSFPISRSAIFFKVVKLDTSGPEVYRTSPFNGAIGVNQQEVIQAWLRDESAIDPNSISFAIGTNAPVNLRDPRLNYTNGLVVYSPAANEVFGAKGDWVPVRISVSDILGNVTTNFAWSFQLELPVVVATDIVFISDSGSGAPCNLTLVSTNADLFTFVYSGGNCITNGTKLVNTNLLTGYARTVLSFTNYPDSNTVVALTRPSKLGELLQSGSLSLRTLNVLNPVSGQTKALRPKIDVSLDLNQNLGGTLYSQNGLALETLPSSYIDLNSDIQVNINIESFQIKSVQVLLSQSATLELDFHATAGAGTEFGNDISMVPESHHVFGGLIGSVPVWVDLVLGVNAGYDVTLSSSISADFGGTGTLSVSAGKSWDPVNGLADIPLSRTGTFTVRQPAWQLNGDADFRVYVQPYLKLLLYSLAGVKADVEPYLDLSGSGTVNPWSADLALSYGVDFDLGIDLSVFDGSLTDLPNITIPVLAPHVIWQTNYPSVNLTISSQPLSTSASLGSSVSFSVQAKAGAPLQYQWLKNGLSLTDDSRISGTQTSTLSIANVQSGDFGAYSVRVMASSQSVVSNPAALTLLSDDLLVCALSFDGNLQDSTGDCDFASFGALTYASGLHGLAAHLDGNSTFVYSACPVTQFGQLDFTIIIWIRSLIGGGLVSHTACGSIGGFQISMNPPGFVHQVLFEINEDYTTMAKLAVPIELDNNWHQIVMVRKSNHVKCYVDFQNTAETDTADVTFMRTVANLQIGAPGPCSTFAPSFYGDVDEFKVYLRALSDYEIQQLYNNR